jgi:microcystin-dependent protein
MAEFFMGQIEVFAFNFPPRGWAMCNGALLSINQNQALFSLLGTQFGGDGIRTFALPDLRGRAGNGIGQGPGLSSYDMGTKVGVESHVVTSAEMPAAHTHALNARVNGTTGGTNTPGPSVVMGSGYSAKDSSTINVYAPSTSTLTPMTSLNPVGGQAHENRMPFNVLNYCICVQGMFPSRN